MVLSEASAIPGETTTVCAHTQFTYVNRSTELSFRIGHNRNPRHRSYHCSQEDSIQIPRRARTFRTPLPVLLFCLSFVSLTGWRRTGAFGLPPLFSSVSLLVFKELFKLRHFQASSVTRAQTSHLWSNPTCWPTTSPGKKPSWLSRKRTPPLPSQPNMNRLTRSDLQHRNPRSRLPPFQCVFPLQPRTRARLQRSLLLRPPIVPRERFPSHSIVRACRSHRRPNVPQHWRYQRP